MISTVDTQARHTRKSKSKLRDGFRGHVAAEPETGLITDCEMTMAAGDGSTDAENGVKMAARDRSGGGPAARDQPAALRRLRPRTAVIPPGLLRLRARRPGWRSPGTGTPGNAGPETLLARRPVPLTRGTRRHPPRPAMPGPARIRRTRASRSSRYRARQPGAGDLRRLGLRQRGGPRRLPRRRDGTVIKPKPVQPLVPGGFTVDDFTVSEDDGTVTCPAGVTRPMSPARTVTFGAACAGCPLRSKCTTAKDGRSMTIHPHEQLLREARAQARTPEFRQAYPTRSAIERIIPGPPPRTGGG